MSRDRREAAPRPTLRRAALGGALCCGALLLASCASLEGTPEREPRTGRPSAPAQAMPPARDAPGLDASDATDLGAPEPADPVAPSRAETPIADLPDPAWAEQAAESTGIPLRAVRAYAGAALAVEQSHPQCGLGWNALAGIGRIESRHGTLGGSEVGEDGVVSPRIIGVPLDGGEGVMAIPDTDGGELDGDDEWDRAVGPMQFIPETWAATARDGDRDGRTDPHQIDDAALTAAAYLCERGGMAADDDDWAGMVFGYNRSSDYLWNVTEAAEDYAARTAS